MGLTENALFNYYNQNSLNFIAKTSNAFFLKNYFVS